MNPWLALGIAIVLEVAGTVCLKLSAGMSRWLPIVGVIVFYTATFALMAISMKVLEVGTAYAVWAGVGTALITLIGIGLFGESFGWTKLVGTALVIGGVVLLHASAEEASGRTREQGGQLHEIPHERDGQE